MRLMRKMILEKLNTFFSDTLITLITNFLLDNLAAIDISSKDL